MVGLEANITAAYAGPAPMEIGRIDVESVMTVAMGERKIAV